MRRRRKHNKGERERERDKGKGKGQGKGKGNQCLFRAHDGIVNYVLFVCVLQPWKKWCVCILFHLHVEPQNPGGEPRFMERLSAEPVNLDKLRYVWVVTWFSCKEKEMGLSLYLCIFQRAARGCGSLHLLASAYNLGVQARPILSNHLLKSFYIAEFVAVG